jgi:hypothetical protein
MKDMCELGPLTPMQRRQKAFQIRSDAALYERNLPLPGHPCNGDDALYPNKIASYSKALPHNSIGEVELSAYNAFIRALKSGRPDDFEAIPLGGPDGNAVKLTDPQAGLAFELVGPDSHHLSIPPAPAFSSAWEASEMAELYWRTLTRDVPFADYDSDPLTIAAANDLSRFSDFRGPKEDGVVTTGTLFRENVPGDLIGPFVSQFLWKDIPYGATTIVQRYHVPVAGVDFLTNFDEWLDIQNGSPPNSTITFDPTQRYIRNGRDLGEYVHRDFAYQAVLGACQILLSFGPAALDPANPYFNSKTQVGFATFGAPYILDFVAKVARAALEAAWFQKFFVHRRLRPEEFGGRVHNLLTGAANYPINQELLHSEAVKLIHDKYGTYLLPIAYPEGCPTHPAYPGGHADFVGAGVTILKAFFNESFEIPNPVVASADGLQLLPYSGPSLTIGGELNKLASNITHGRDTAGLHWRSDGSEGLKLGEAVAIGILRDYRATYNERFSGFTLTKFDGTTIKI